MNKIAVVYVLAGALILSGCSQAEDESLPDADTETTGVDLVVDFQGDTDVAGFEYKISECKGTKKDKPSKVVAHEIKDLEDMTLPGMIPEFDNDPFDEGSNHLFADYFTALPAGCYDVNVQPVDKYGNPSSDCDSASATNVQVEDGATTELLLISQCEGAERGAIDVVAALNHPPRIETLKLDKFQQECNQVQICATASDPDGDPIEFKWKQLGGPQLVQDIETDGNGHSFCDGTCDFEEYDEFLRSKESEVKDCVSFQLGLAGDYEFQLGVFDLYWDDGTLVRFADSSAHIEFPIYATEGDKECPPKDEDGNKLY